MNRVKVVAFLRDRVVFAKLAAAVLWACYAASILLGDPAVPTNLKGQLVTADHLAFYTAARFINDGRQAEIYDPATDGVVAQFQAGLFPGVWENTVEAYRNPPFYALLYTPTARLPFRYSTLIWFGIHVVLLAAGVRWLAPAEWKPMFAWCLAFYPVFAAFSYGQNTLISFAILAGTFRLMANGRLFLAGMAAGLLLFKPQLLLGLGVWAVFDIRTKWKCAVGAAATGLILFAASYPVVPDAWRAFANSLTANAGFDNFEQWKMHNPLAFWRLLLPGLTRWHAPLAAACSALVLLGFVRIWRNRRADLGVMFGASVVVTLLAGPHALVYEWALLAATGILWRPAVRENPDAWFVVVAAIWTVFFVSTNASEFQTYASPVVVQLSVPACGWAWWRAGRLLRPAP